LSNNTPNDQQDISFETLSTPPLKIDPAPLNRRLAANAIDSILVAMFWWLVSRTIGLALDPFHLIALFAIVLAYFFLFEWLFAASLGKHLLKLRVVGITDGDPCSAKAALVRNVLRLIDWLPAFYLVGLSLIVKSRSRQRLGDRVANTIVAPAPARDEIPPPAPFLFH